MTLFDVVHPTGGNAPIVLSVPHCGATIPDELKDLYKPEKIQFIDDTDWFVEQLYSFAPEMGITLISAKISRWVIDLNRDPENKPLYSDGRVITDVCTTTDFLGNPIYADNRKVVDVATRNERIEKYYRPYHSIIEASLAERKKEFGKVLLWDCHSIRQFVPSIRQEKFPDLILGDADGTSASPGLIECALKDLETAGLAVSHNYPFKGGYITRHFGRPSEGMHALQLEMSKINYMDDTETRWMTSRASRIQDQLKRTLTSLSEALVS